MNITVHNTETIIDDLKHNKEAFTLSLTTFTKKLECSFGTFRYVANGEIKQRELYFIQKVKSHVLNLPKYPVINREEISYIKNFMTGNNKVFNSQIYEVDLSAAYWSITYQDGYLSKELHDEGLKLSKKIRLVALGALAKQLTILNYDGEKFGMPTKEPLHPSANVFFNACLKTALIMNQARLLMPRDVFFIWSDAIFFRGNKNLLKIKTFLKEKDIKFKEFSIDKITYKNKIATIYSKEYADKHKGEREERPFNFKII